MVVWAGFEFGSTGLIGSGLLAWMLEGESQGLNRRRPAAVVEQSARPNEDTPSTVAKCTAAMLNTLGIDSWDSWEAEPSVTI